MSYDATQVIGIRKEDVVETDPIDAVDAKYWKIGLDGMANNFPQEEHVWVPLYYGDRDPGDIVLQGSVVKTVLGSLPVNMIDFYRFLGASTTDASDIHTITGINTGNLETQTIRSESRGGLADKFWSTVGNRMQMINFSMDLRNKQIPAVMSTGYQGIMLQDAGTTPAMSLTTAHEGTVYPTDDGTMTGTELDDTYRFDTNFSFIWDQGSDNVEYRTALQAFAYLGVNDLGPHSKQNQVDIEKLYEGQRGHVFSFEVRMGLDSAIWDDYIARTKHALRLKVYNTAARYIQLDMADFAMNKPNPISAIKRDERIYHVEGIFKTLTVTGIDGIEDYGSGGVEEFYGETS